MVDQLPYPPAPGVADRFTVTEPAELVEPFTQAAASVAARVGLADVDDAGAGNPRRLQVGDGHGRVLALEVSGRETSRNYGGSSVGRTMTPHLDRWARRRRVARRTAPIQ
ncbi:hypothetical protein [Mycobacterium sp. 852014-52144_SCH5372336]|uniref:hypothetical protein n=1 Tax=Mycobacterium sp. 852014-52144_SCH5372336 TaxID=1834115 RepID=UPI000AE40C5A|nr:hypothetical protein [Mycobacterium sp. 852014-52144_SCH5372336]